MGRKEKKKTFKGVASQKTVQGEVIEADHTKLRYRAEHKCPSDGKVVQEWYPVDDITSDAREAELFKQQDVRAGKTDLTVPAAGKNKSKKTERKRCQCEDERCSKLPACTCTFTCIGNAVERVNITVTFQCITI